MDVSLAVPATKKRMRKKTKRLYPRFKRPKNDAEAGPEYDVRRIVDEDSTRYLIDWEDGPDGEKYDPTWEPKENANQEAVDEWMVTKLAKEGMAEEAQRGQDHQREGTHGTPIDLTAEQPLNVPEETTEEQSLDIPQEITGEHLSQPADQTDVDHSSNDVPPTFDNISDLPQPSIEAPTISIPPPPVTLLHPQTQTPVRPSPYSSSAFVQKTLTPATDTSSLTPRPMPVPRPSLKDQLQQIRDNAIHKVMAARAASGVPSLEATIRSMHQQSPGNTDDAMSVDQVSQGPQSLADTVLDEPSVAPTISSLEATIPTNSQSTTPRNADDAMSIDQGSQDRISPPNRAAGGSQEFITPSALAMEQSQEPSELGTLLTPRDSLPNSHLVLLPLTGVAREIYSNIITKQKASITSIMQGSGDDLCKLRVTDMLRDLRLLCNHQDLVSEPFEPQTTLDDSDLSRWSQSCSTKCLFLRTLLDEYRNEEKHLAILVDKGHSMDFIECILKTEKLNYSRPDTMSTNRRSYDPLQISLLPTSGDTKFVVRNADVVIAFDSTFRSNGYRYADILRRNLVDSTRLAPLITLAINRSIEHVELCLPEDDCTDLEFVTCVTRTRKMAGDAGDFYQDPLLMATNVAEYLLDDSDTKSWPLSFQPQYIPVGSPTPST